MSRNKIKLNRRTISWSKKRPYSKISSKWRIAIYVIFSIQYNMNFQMNNAESLNENKTKFYRIFCSKFAFFKLSQHMLIHRVSNQNEK